MRDTRRLVCPGVCLLAAVVTLLALCQASPDAKRLYDDLLGEKGGYNKLIRPVGNTSDRLVVKIGLRLSQIIDVVSAPLADHRRGECWSRRSSTW